MDCDRSQVTMRQRSNRLASASLFHLMTSRALLVLRIGLGITFIWIGTLIVQDPAGWAGLIRSDVSGFMIGDPTITMRATGIFDILLGLMFIFGVWLWLMGLIGAIHMLIVIATIYLGDSTARDVGILGGCLAVTLSSPMPGFAARILRR
jgi:uncharacterized membrane protein YphA (DoxX/SURF4 family)